jgi:hypothetical protein
MLKSGIAITTRGPPAGVEDHFQAPETLHSQAIMSNSKPPLLTMTVHITGSTTDDALLHSLGGLKLPN